MHSAPLNKQRRNTTSSSAKTLSNTIDTASRTVEVLLFAVLRHYTISSAKTLSTRSSTETLK